MHMGTIGIAAQCTAVLIILWEICSETFPFPLRDNFFCLMCFGFL